MNNKEWPKYIAVLSFMIGLFTLLWNSTDLLLDLSAYHFGEEIISNLVTLLIVFIVFWLSGEFIWIWGIKKYLKKRWFARAIYFMVAIFIIGFIFIHHLFAKPMLKIQLYDEYGQRMPPKEPIAYLSCPDRTSIMVDSHVQCRLQSHGKIIFPINFFLFEFTHLNGSRTYHHSGDAAFTAPDKVNEVKVTVTGDLTDGQTYEIGGKTAFTFPTEEQEASRRDKHLGFLIGLLGIVLFAVPAAAVHMRDLWQDRKR